MPVFRVASAVKRDQAGGKPPVRPTSLAICSEVKRESVDHEEGIDPW